MALNHPNQHWKWGFKLCWGMGGMSTTPPSYGSICERRHTTVPPIRPQMEDQLIRQEASFIGAATPAASSTMLGVNMTRPVTPPNQMEQDRWYALVVTASIRRLNLEMTGVILGDTVITLPIGSAFQNPCMVAVLSGRVNNNQGTTVKELDAE